MKPSLQNVGVPLIAGLVGLGVTVWFAGDRGAGAERLSASGSIGAAAADSRSPRDADALLSAYRRAESYNEAAPIEARLAELFSTPYSTARDAEINALFQRLADIDLQRAVRIASVPGFDPALLADVFRALNQADADSTLNLLAGIEDHQTQIDLAVVLASVLGHEPAALSRITAALPPDQEVAFLSAAMGDLALHDPADALRRAVQISDSGARNAAIRQVGRQSALVDPVAALNRADEVPAILRQAYRDAILLEWAQLDVAAFLAFADSQNVLNGLEAGLVHALAVDPANTYRVASRHPRLPMTVPLSTASTLETIAFANAAADDLDGYRLLLESVTDPARKSDLTRAFAETYALQRPEEALAWARAIGNPSAEMQVIAAVGSVDYALAIESMLDFDDRIGNRLASFQLIPVLAQEAVAAAPADVASGLLAQGDHPTATAMLSVLMDTWVVADPGEALGWIRDNPESVDQDMIGRLAIRLSSAEAAKAAEYTDLLLPENRNMWLQQVADAYTFQDLEGTLNWLSQYDRGPEYELVLRRVLERLARVSPPDATELMKIAPVEMQRNTAAEIVTWLVGYSFDEASRWVVTIEDEQTRQNAYDRLATDWTTRAPDAAQRWAIGLPAGPDRDYMLNSMLSRLARDGYDIAIRPDIFDSFDSGALRDSAVESVVVNLARQDPDRAEAFISRVVTDRDLRRRAEAALEQYQL